MDTDGWLAGDQMYMNHDEQEEDCDSEPDEQLYLNLPEAAGKKSYSEVVIFFRPYLSQINSFPRSAIFWLN